MSHPGAGKGHSIDLPQCPAGDHAISNHCWPLPELWAKPCGDVGDVLSPATSLWDLCHLIAMSHSIIISLSMPLHALDTRDVHSWACASCLLPLLTYLSLPGLPLPTWQKESQIPLHQFGLCREQNQNRIERLIPSPSKQTVSIRAAQEWTDLFQFHPGPGASSISKTWGQSRSASSCGLFYLSRTPSALGLHFRGSFTSHYSSCHLSPFSFFRSVSSPWHMPWLLPCP